MKGIFITFEGPDGAGKTTQVRMLAQALEKAGHDIVMTREPGGTSISDRIRSLVLSPEHKEMTHQAEVLLYAASRAQHVHELIIPSLEQGKIVICDRFIDASMAYQAYGLGLSAEAVWQINAFASSGLKPTRTYMLDLPVEVSAQRLMKRTEGALDRIEQKGVAYHSRVREGFHDIAQKNQDRIKIVDATQPIEKMAEQIFEDCLSLLNHSVS